MEPELTKLIQDSLILISTIFVKRGGGGGFRELLTVLGRGVMTLILDTLRFAVKTNDRKRRTDTLCLTTAT